MSIVIHLDIPGLPKTVNVWRAGHWKARWAEDRKWKQSVGEHLLFALKGKLDKPFQRARLTLTRCSSRCPDADALVASFKSCVDGLVEHGVLAGDTMAHIGMPTYLWEKAPLKQGHIKIVVEEKEA